MRNHVEGRPGVFNRIIIKPTRLWAGRRNASHRTRVVWSGRLGAPIEDTLGDAIEMNPQYHDRLILGAK
jgi:hypothetical protein